VIPPSLGRLVPLTGGGRLALVAVAVIFVVIRGAEARGTVPFWAASRLDDLLIMPLLLTVVLAAHRLAGRSATWVLPLGHSLPVLVAYSLFFEAILPRLDSRAISDILDVPAYAAGWLVFQFLLNKPGESTGDNGQSDRS